MPSPAAKAIPNRDRSPNPFSKRASLRAFSAAQRAKRVLLSPSDSASSGNARHIRSQSSDDTCPATPMGHFPSRGSSLFIPEVPLSAFSQLSSTSKPSGAARPRPVIRTFRPMMSALFRLGPASVIAEQSAHQLRTDYLLMDVNDSAHRSDLSPIHRHPRSAEGISVRSRDEPRRDFR